MKKVLLLFPVWNTGLCFHHGIQYVSATMTRQGIENDILILDKPDCLPILFEMLNDGYDCIAATSTSCEFEKLNDLAKKMVKYRSEGIRYLLGGAHITNTFDKGFFDSVHIGDYYQPDNLDDLPDYLLGKMPLQRILDLKNGWLSTIVSRGCPYGCAYCINSVRKQPPKRMSAGAAVNHIAHIKESLQGVKVVNFDDDNLANDKAWLQSFLAEYDHVIHKPYVINVRAIDITENLAALLSNTNCHEVQIGVECGSESIRRNILNKRVFNKTIVNAFDLCHKYGLRTLAYIMHGIPFTLGNQAIQTADFVKQLQPTLIRDTYFYPWQGTALRRKCEDEDLLIRPLADNYYDVSCFTGEDSEKKKFRELLSEDYGICGRNKNYLERRKP